MNEKILATLEYSKIIDKLHNQAATSLGKQLVMELHPHTVLEVVKTSLQKTDEATTAIRLKGTAPFGGIVDNTLSYKRARIGGTLQAEELLHIAATIYGTRQVKRFVGAVDHQEPIPMLHQDALELIEHKEVEEAIFNCIGEQAEILDTASSKLAIIRRELRSGEGRIREKLESMIRSSSIQKMLQDSIITLRNNRFVIPVKQEYRSNFGGIIHDQSGSGATLFIEPEAIVNMNNRLRELKADEEREIEKILQMLTAQVAEYEEDLMINQHWLAQLDFAFAKAGLAHQMKAVQPKMNDRGFIKIRRGCHPLIDRDKVVPLDIEIGNQYSAIIVTGPNTGGKTVTLKTIGLLSLMAMSGLFVPTDEGSQFCVFDAIFADIGDEQSIEQNLSTFSSHMTNIISILGQLTAKSLVLLDELGAGTDPAEGSALAIALLEYIHNKDCRIVATTHYSELKAFAYNRRGMINASMEFDVATLSPTYKLLVGVPGRSNAFAIAKRLGLSSAIIERAEGEVSEEDTRVENMIASLEENRLLLEQEKQTAEIARQQMEALREKYEREQRRLEEQKQKILDKANQEAAALVAKASEEADQVIHELRELAKTEVASVKEHKLIEAKRKLEEAKPKQSSPIRQVTSTSNQKKITAGDDVLVISLNQKGSIVELQGKEALVQLGIMRMKVALTDLELLQSAPAVKPLQQAASLNRSRSDDVKMELDLRGENLEDAMMETDRFLDEAFLAGMGQVYLIHGKGTGVLRTGLQQFLRNHSHVKSYRNGEFSEGGNGVTVVVLQ
ncbi:endonuclease MutS2 [Paenibacillus yanchengensis]|uniref:Endonuclease MutS2 n=1 Tax=Paenibacillus yanchengensis TaxID=2035833 RepID=A0ABW4YLL0_9BACL